MINVQIFTEIFSKYKDWNSYINSQNDFFEQYHDDNHVSSQLHRWWVSIQVSYGNRLNTFASHCKFTDWAFRSRKI